MPNKITPPLDNFSEATIIHKTYRFYLELYSCTQRFPKKDRYAVGLKCETVALELLEELFSANAKRDHEKLPELKKADLKLQMLKLLVRLVFDIRAVSQKKYLELQKFLQEIGRMLGGWIKSIEKTPQ